MTFELRPYQEDIIARTREALRHHNSVLIQSPTGSGKTALIAKMIGTAAQRGIPSFFLVHRAELIDQTELAFQKVNIPYGVIAAGYPSNPLVPVQICSIDTLKGRLDKLPFRPKFIVFDEAHHIAAGGWSKIKSHFSDGVKAVGATATPERLDGKGLKDYFSSMVCGPTVNWLMNNVDPKTGLTYLCKYRAFAPFTPDLKNVETKMGDYAKGQVAEIMDTATITGDAIKEYMRLAPDRLGVAFCINVNHSKHVAEQFRQAGIVAFHIDGTTPKQERRKAIQAFREGKIRILTSVNIFGEGFDLPAIEVAILLRPTRSLSLHLQMIGRALRMKEEKALILDHAGNLRRLGLPCEDRQWSLEGRKKGKRTKNDEADIVNRQCPKCYACHPPANVCPECGHVYEVKVRAIEHKEGDLAEVDLEAAKQAKKWQDKREQANARTEAELVELGKKRGYNHPEKWAENIIKYRKAKR